jgi:ATP-binding cassette subfamily B (MDR/TAP) protein 1
MSSLRISAAIRLEYMRCLFGQPVSTLDLLPPGQTAAIITITASILQIGISEKLSAFLQSLSTVIAALVIATSYSWSLTLITSSGLVLITIVYAVTTPFLVKLLNEVQHADIQASTTANEIFGSIRMISACGAEDKMAKRYAGWVDESRRRGLRMSPLIALQQAPSELSGRNWFGNTYAFVCHANRKPIAAVQFAIYGCVTSSILQLGLLGRHCVSAC